MWEDKLKEIIKILENSNVNEIEVKFWNKTYRVVKNPSISKVDIKENQSNNINIDDSEVPKDSINTDEENKETNRNKVLSPMPGVFYSSQSPEKPPFVREGDSVKSGQVLCIIESMKIMNEIESDNDGVIKKVLVKNSDPVEFNQPLFIIEQF